MYFLKKAQEHRKERNFQCDRIFFCGNCDESFCKMHHHTICDRGDSKSGIQIQTEADIIGVTPCEETLRRMQIYWGVTPVKSIEYNTTEDICNDAIDLVTAKRLVDRVILS